MVKKKHGDETENAFHGGSKDDAYDGLAGNDEIYGMGGNDKLWGGAGNDTIWGGPGKDVIWGGADADRFIFYQTGKFAGGGDIDIIKDFDTKSDGGDLDDRDILEIMSADQSNHTAQDVMKHASQDGADVRIDFGHGDVLILEDTKIKHISLEYIAVWG